MDSLLSPSLTPQIQTKHQKTPFRHSKSLEMTAESGERLVTRLGTRPAEPEQLPCPRCDSTNTKFCYYNNYNLSQPRHFCKSCRRYWTRGGALRNVPVGGSTRKAHSSNKRPRVITTAPTSAAPTSSNRLVSCGNENDVMGQTQTIDPVVSNPTLGSGSGAASAVNLNETAERTESGNLSSWWGGQMGIGDGLLPLNGYGLGLGPGLGYGLGMLDWPMEQMGGENGSAVVESPGGNAWQMGGGGESGMAEGDYFSWPDPAISTSSQSSQVNGEKGHIFSRFSRK